MIIKSLYSFATVRRLSDVLPATRQMQALLIEWETCLPETLKVLPQGYKGTDELGHDNLRNRLDFTMKYHEAILVIHQR